MFRIESAWCSAALMVLGACSGKTDTAVTNPQAEHPHRAGEVVADSSGVGVLDVGVLQAPMSKDTIAQQREGGRLNALELEQIAKTGVVPNAFNGPSLSGDADDQRFVGGQGKKEGAQQAKGCSAAHSLDLAAGRPATNGTAAYRFYNNRTGAHVYAASQAERDQLRKTQPFMSYEGEVCMGNSAAKVAPRPVHRFYNLNNHMHIYTDSETERNHIRTTMPHYSYEGLGQYVRGERL